MVNGGSILCDCFLTQSIICRADTPTTNNEKKILFYLNLELSDGGMVFDSPPELNVMSLMTSEERIVSLSESTDSAPRLRKEFPETWIWTNVTSG